MSFIPGLSSGPIYEAAASGTNIDVSTSTFTGIRAFRIVLEAASDHSITTAIILTMNSITSYSSSYTQADANGSTPTMDGSGLDGFETVSIKVGSARGADYAVNLFNVTTIDVYAWEDSDRFTSIYAESFNPSDGATANSHIHWSVTAGAVKSSAAIATVKLALSTGDFVTGSRVKVYAI